MTRLDWSLTCCWLLTQRQFEGVESPAELVGNNETHAAPSNLLSHIVDDQLGSEHAFIGPLLQHLRYEVLVERLAALQQLQVVPELPEDLRRAGVGSETHQDLLGLAGLEIVKSLRMISSHGLELDVEEDSRLVPLLVEVVLAEAAVLHHTDQTLAVVAGLGLVVQLLDLPHAAVGVDLLLQVRHRPLVGLRAQHPAELDGGPGSVCDAGHLQGKVKYQTGI